MNKFIGKTILVTGATGLIGSNLVYKLINIKNIKIIAIGRSIKKLNICFKEYKKNFNLILIAHDISDPISI